MAETAVCPWCGGHLWDPFTGLPIDEDRVVNSLYDRALEAHVEDCEPFLAEQPQGRF